MFSSRFHGGIGVIVLAGRGIRDAGAVRRMDGLQYVVEGVNVYGFGVATDESCAEH